MAITKEQIIDAAEQLQANGVNPTMQAIRNALEGGSFATISPVLREWRDSKKQRATVALDMPGEAKAALERAGADLWRIVTALATERLTKVQEEAETAVNGAQADRDEALFEIERLETSIEQKDAELTEALSANEVSTNALNDALEEIRALEIQLADKARIEAENGRLTTALTELSTENKALVEEKFVLVGAVKDAENTLERTENTLSSVEKELAKVTEQLKEVEAKTAKLQTENNSFDLQTQKLQIALDASETKTSELKAECAELRKMIGNREREAGALAGELKAITAENKGLKTDLEKVRAQTNTGKSKN